jgi:site-specific recombinase XerD
LCGCGRVADPAERGGGQDVKTLFAGWREELASCRKFAPTARNYVASQLMSKVGLRVNEARCLDLADIKWELVRFGKLHVRIGKGARCSGPRERMVPLINGADRVLRWYVEDVWGHFDDDYRRAGAPLLPSERKNADGTCRRVGDDALRAGLAAAAAEHLPAWADKLTPHLLRHYAASELYLSGLDLISIQELLGHAWIASTLHYIHVHRSRIEDAWVAGQQRAAQRPEGLLS